MLEHDITVIKAKTLPYRVELVTIQIQGAYWRLLVYTVKNLTVGYFTVRMAFLTGSYVARIFNMKEMT